MKLDTLKQEDIKIEYTQRFTDYVRKKGIKNISIRGVERGSEMECKVLEVHALKEKEIPVFENSKYFRFTDGPCRVFLSPDLILTAEAITLDVRRLLGVIPDLKAIGLEVPNIFY